MAFPTLSVKDGTGATQTINTTPNAGQNTMANSLGVVIASDQSAVPVTGTFYQTTQPVSAAASAIADGADVTQGTKADTAYAGSGSSSVIGLLKGLYNGLIAATPAGTNFIGKIGFGQSSTTENDVSGTITIGGTAQTIQALTSTRIGFEIQNNSTGDLWFSTTATAVQNQPSFRIPSGQTYTSPDSKSPTGAISIIGATTGQTFSARTW